MSERRALSDRGIPFASSRRTTCVLVTVGEAPVTSFPDLYTNLPSTAAAPRQLPLPFRFLPRFGTRGSNPKPVSSRQTNRSTRLPLSPNELSPFSLLSFSLSLLFSTSGRYLPEVISRRDRFPRHDCFCFSSLLRPSVCVLVPTVPRDKRSISISRGSISTSLAGSGIPTTMLADRCRPETAQHVPLVTPRRRSVCHYGCTCGSSLSISTTTRSDLDSKEIDDLANDPSQAKRAAAAPTKIVIKARRYAASNVRDDNADQAAKRRLR